MLLILRGGGRVLNTLLVLNILCSEFAPRVRAEPMVKLSPLPAVNDVKSHTAANDEAVANGGTLADNADWKACVASKGLQCNGADLECKGVPNPTCLYVYMCLPNLSFLSHTF